MKKMVAKLVFASIILCGTVDDLRSQDQKSNFRQLELGVAAFLTAPIQFTAFEAQGSIPVIEAELSSGFELSTGCYWKIDRAFDLYTGISFGVHSVAFSIQIPESYRAIGWQGYSDRFTEYELRNGSVTTAVRLSLPAFNNDQIYVRTGFRMCYPWRTLGQIESFAITRSGQAEFLFSSELIQNNENRVVLLPEALIHYAWIPEQGRIFFSAGLEAGYSRFESVKGSFQFYGDNATLGGELSKGMWQYGVSFRISYLLKRRIGA